MRRRRCKRKINTLKKSASICLFFTLMFSLFSCSNLNEKQSEKAEESSPCISDFQTFYEEPGNTDLIDQRIIYYENFEDEKVSRSSEEVLSSLGWVADTVSNGAYCDNTTSYSIVSRDNSKKLLLQNYRTSGTDSYVIILSAAQMGKYHEKNYTYQYDICYSSASDAKRYIALVSEYKGDFYNTFHLRFNGSANNQVHTDSTWLSYDVKGTNYAASTDKNSISNKIFGVDFSENSKLLEGVSVSIRYVVDWENGNSVYLRLNTEGYESSGEWILVSKLSASSTGASYFKPNSGGAGIALKTGGKINGYIDNIIVWKGVGDEPSDKSERLVLKNGGAACSGHTYAGQGTCVDPVRCIYCGELSKNNTNGAHLYLPVGYVDDYKCEHCLGYKSAIECGWILSKVPAYTGGKASSSLYLSGQGIDSSAFSEKDESLMCIVSNTNEKQFTDYTDVLLSYGAKEVYTHSFDGNICAQYEFYDNSFVYVYFTASVKEARIIYDNQSESSLQDFGYTYEKNVGESTVVYQYGLPMKDGSSGDADKIGYGMMYVIKLADNSVFIIDGGGYQQFDTAQIDGFMQFLREITGTKVDEKIKISAWYISHAHQDHMAGFLLFVKKYCAYLDFDRIFFNFPTVNSDVGVIARSESVYKKMLQYFDKYIKDDGVKYMKIHTGQVFNIADAKVNVLYTHEDIVDPYSCASEIASDYNNTSAVISVQIDEKTFLFLGDINKPAMKVLMENNQNLSLKCDVIQLAHHVVNDLSSLYNIARASVAFVPQSEYTATKNSTMRNTLNAALKYVTDDNAFYANEETVGIEVKAGKLQVTYKNTVKGGKYTGWNW